MDIAQRKQGLRQHYKEQLRSMSSSAKADASAAMVQHLEKMVYFQQSTAILLYAPLPSEPDFLPLFEKYHLQKKFVFPRVAPAGLALHVVVDLRLLAAATGKLKEPPADLPQINPAEIDLALIPGLAFCSETGARLGRGGGYYDRLLALQEFHAFTLGVCFALQLREQELPLEPHDYGVRAVLTEHGC
jgi:5-formyltetrahydrofolate cyclo-ligase